MRKRPDGRWEGRYTAGRDPVTGKAIYKNVLAKTQKECKEKLARAIEKSGKIDVAKSGQYTVEEWCWLWHESYCKPAVKDSTAEYYRSYIEHHIAPNIGKIKLEKLTTLELQKFYNKTKKSGRVEKYEGMEDRSLSARTVRGLHAMLRTALDQAVRERLIPFNPAIGCRLPPKEKKEMQILPAEQIGAYLSAAEEHGVLPMFYLELTTGLRRGELTALLWTDLDVEARTLTVSKSAGRLKGEVRVTQPKTANSVRTICLPKETVDLLVQEHEKHPSNPYMFPSPTARTALAGCTRHCSERPGSARACLSTDCVIRSQLWRSSRVWTSKRCPTSWGTIARASRWTPTPTSPGRCKRRRRTAWAASSPRPSDKESTKTGSAGQQIRRSLKFSRYGSNLGRATTAKNKCVKKVLKKR